MKEQILDSMDIERERGITIKAQTVRLDYKAQGWQGLSAQPDGYARPCRFRLQGLAIAGGLRRRDPRCRREPGREAQTLANVYQALDNNLEILPVLNKVDLPSADVDRVKEQIEDVIGIDASDAVPVSAKTGKNVEAVLEAIIHRLPPPKGERTKTLKASLIDSWYDAYLGVIRARPHHRRRAQEGLQGSS